uniref:Uncharacterized protein n=1 Tax=Leersia perrieri TaxID=77586 RepID=A0A0D9WT72_9ORYZ
MASAVASNLPAASPAAVMPFAGGGGGGGWLGPRVSFSAGAAEDVVVVCSSSSSSPVVAAAATPEPAISKDFIDFEFSLGCSATMLPADELFADGKLLPLRKPPPAALPEPATRPPQPEATMPTASEPMKPLRSTTAAIDATAADPYVFSPKAPSCSSRWRELLGLKRAAAQTPKPSPCSAPARTPARATNSTAARSLKLLLQRNAGRSSTSSVSELASAPLLRDSSDSEASLSLASSRFSLSSSSSSSGHDHDDFPRLSLDSAVVAGDNPPRIRLVRSSHRHSTSSSTRAGRNPARRRPSPPPAPRCLSVDSPRMNSSGKIVFQGLERSSSSPCTLHGGGGGAGGKPRPRAAVDRSYSSGGRVAPVVLNVPVCSRPVFGFFKDKKDSSATAKDGMAAARTRSSLGRKTAAWSGELGRSCG